MQRFDRLALGLVAASVPARLVLSLTTDLSPDEAYYLSAARGGLTIPDHPPLLLWMLAASDRLAHALPVELRVRIWPLTLATMTSIVLVDVARRGSASAGVQRWAAALSCWLPMPFAGGFLATPDAPAVLAISLLLRTETEASRPLTALAAGLASFLGTLSKLIVAPTAIAVALFSVHRIPLAAAICAGLLAAAPLATSSLRFQLAHAFLPASWGLSAAVLALLVAVLAQVALWPPVALALLKSRFHLGSRAFYAVLFVSAAAFAASALARAVPPEPNWFAPGCIVLLLHAARVLPNTTVWTKRTSIALGPALTLVAATHVAFPWLPLPTAQDPSARLHGWSTHRPKPAAPGVGPYGIAAERCIYQHSCEEINEYIHNIRAVSSSVTITNPKLR